MTPQDIKKQWRRQGITMKSWAKERGFNPDAVSMIINGQLKGRYGQSHRIAVALGLKTDSGEAAKRTA